VPCSQKRPVTAVKPLILDHAQRSYRCEWRLPNRAPAGGSIHGDGSGRRLQEAGQKMWSADRSNPSVDFSLPVGKVAPAGRGAGTFGRGGTDAPPSVSSRHRAGPDTKFASETAASL